MHERIRVFAPDTDLAEVLADDEVAATFRRSQVLLVGDESDLAAPPRAIEEALAYAHEMYRGRALLRARLREMRANACANAVQPRGSADPERRTQLVPEVPRAGAQYGRFLAAQRDLRTRFG